jgi:hypothetical protein
MIPVSPPEQRDAGSLIVEEVIGFAIEKRSRAAKAPGSLDFGLVSAGF